ncbi:MAG: signal peptidase I [Eubacterium sp.]|nr:signal peptidase I [Eubacterium sp.]
MKKLGNIISNILLAVLLVLLAVFLIIRFGLHMELKAVLTPSMEPELSVGSLLFINPTSYEDIQIGDDITFVRDESLTLVTHRVIQKDDETQQITTKGLANNVADAPTAYQNVVGKVTFSIPLVGYIVIWTANLQGKIICGIIIAALVAVSIIFSGSSPEKKKEPQPEEEQQQE